MALKLPVSVVTLTDLKRVTREAKQIDDFMHQANLRQKGEKLELPRSSVGLDGICEANGFNLLQPDDRKELIDQLIKLDGHTPVMHMSFATSPSDAVMHKIVDWFRTQIDPAVLLQVGLQPSIAGGCTLRTNSKYFDFSLRRYLDQHEATLIDAIKEPKETTKA